MDTEFSSLPQLSATDTFTHPQSKSLKALSREFESLFIQQMLSVMREGIGEDGLFEGNTGQDTYSSMMDQALARALAERGGLGIADPLYQHLKAMEEAKGRSVPSGAGSGETALSPGAADQAGNAGQEEAGHRVLATLEGGRLTSGLGWRRDPVDGDWRFHRGIDIAAPSGTPVRSVNAGKVVFSGTQGGYGNTVVIESAGGTRIRYAHLKEVSVGTGDYVEEGAHVGAVGSTGRSTGPHLHVEVETQGRLVNPLS